MTIILLASLIGYLAAVLVDALPFNLSAPRWLWYLLWTALSVSLVCGIFGLNRWYLGLAGAGGSLILQRLDDLITVTTDMVFLRYKEALSRSPK